jgi:hypothetical protein
VYLKHEALYKRLMQGSVNYVWMQKNPKGAHQIPSASFYMLQLNAARYHDTSFNLWVEDKEAYEAYAIPPNVTPQRLNSIPSFLEVPVLATSNPIHIWTKVDIARLLVIRHMLGEASEAENAIYTDFDVDDIMADAMPLHERLHTYGAAFTGAYKILRDGTRRVTNFFENGFFAFNFKGLPLLDYIIESVLEDVVPSARTRVYAKMRMAIDEWGVMHHDDSVNPFPSDWTKSVSGLCVQPHSLFKLNPKYVAKLADRHSDAELNGPDPKSKTLVVIDESINGPSCVRPADPLSNPDSSCESPPRP